MGKAGPVAQLVVDAMNVIGSRPDGWWKDRAGASRRLLADLQAMPRAADESITVVYDGRPLDDVPEGAHDGIAVVYARRRGRDGADDRIVELVEAQPTRADIEVVTSDRALAERVRALGASVTGAGTLLRRLGR
jgi:predicted RNA-binding protein with PIN domain